MFATYDVIVNEPAPDAHARGGPDKPEEGKMSKQIDLQNMTYAEAAAFLGYANESSVGDLVRAKKLHRPLTIEDLTTFKAEREAGGGPGRSTPDGRKWYHVRLTEEEWKAFSKEYGERARDPRVAEREAREVAREEAKERLLAAVPGLEL